MFETMNSEQRWNYVRDFLKQHKTAAIVFTKKDGTERNLFGTLDPSILPEVQPSEVYPVKPVDFEVFTIWDIEAGGWRAFKTANLISVESVSE